MPILYWLDVGIGYAFAMLLLATLTGAIVAAVQVGLKSRTKWLADGLMSIIANLDPSKTPGRGEGHDPFAAKTAVLTDEVKQLAWSIVSDVSVKGGTQLAEVIGREEFVLLLLRNAAIGPDGAEGKLWKLCVELTGRTPGDLLGAIQEKLVEMEQAEPQAPAYLWRVKAIHAAGASALAGRVFAWYDNTMRRVEDRVSYAARKWSVLFALGLCAWMNVDSIDLLSRLQSDQQFRTRMAEQGEKAAVAPAQPEKPDVKGAASLLGLKGMLRWEDGPGHVAWEFLLRLLSPGIWLSAVMTSLGTAFWFGLLNKLVGIKSLMQEASEKVRSAREADQRGAAG